MFPSQKINCEIIIIIIFYSQHKVLVLSMALVVFYRIWFFVSLQMKWEDVLLCLLLWPTALKLAMHDHFWGALPLPPDQCAWWALLVASAGGQTLFGNSLPVMAGLPVQKSPTWTQQQAITSQTRQGHESQQEVTGSTDTVGNGLAGQGEGLRMLH